MDKELILKGHRIARGKAEGEALVSHEPISFTGGVDPATGFVIEKGHELQGQKVTGRILVYPVGKGSSIGGYRLLEMARCKTQPAGIINLRSDPVVAVGAIIGNVPMIHRLDGNPIDLIKTGDRVELDADQETVKVRPAPKKKTKN